MSDEEFQKEVDEKIEIIENTLKELKDILWDRQSKRESSSMYKVLKGEKPYTEVQSDVGKVKVDRELMEKMKKHLDNPALRGMVTSKEYLSYPKVAKNVEADKETRGYTWKVKASDDNILIYGSRKYEVNNEKIHRLATNHSKTEPNERVAEVDRRGHPYHPIFNDFNFRKSADNEIIPQKEDKSAFFKQKFKEFKAKENKAPNFIKEIDTQRGK